MEFEAESGNGDLQVRKELLTQYRIHLQSVKQLENRTAWLRNLSGLLPISTGILVIEAVPNISSYYVGGSSIVASITSLLYFERDRRKWQRDLEVTAREALECANEEPPLPAPKLAKEVLGLDD